MSGNLTERDIDAIAAKLAPKITAQLNEHARQFWIEPEEHYQDHLNMRDMHGVFSSARKAMFYAFIGLVAVGLIVLAALGVGGKVAQLVGGMTQGPIR